MLSFSPGAQRVLERLPANGEYTALELLEALWRDESRARELLVQAGLRDLELQRIREKHDRPGRSMTNWPVLRHLELVTQQAHQDSRLDEISTEYLLSAALEIPSFTLLLDQLDIDSHTLKSKLPWTGSLEPLTVDVRLDASGMTGIESMAVYRILDASANRCREGLRVVEDYARMILNDESISRQVKEVRHQLPPLLSRMNIDRAIRARDIEHDVGTSIRTPFELARSNAWSVAVASMKRVEESLRTLEEYGKTIDPASAAAIGQLRYRFYGIETSMWVTQESNKTLKERLLYLLVTDHHCPRGAGPVIKAALRGGVDVIQMREKEMPDYRRIELAKWMRDWTAESGALLIINDRPDIACLVGADGVHVGQSDMPALLARQFVGSERLVGVSTHSLLQAQQAVLDGADYIGVGPVFPSSTKEFTDLAGLVYVEQAAAEIALPSYAIGGIGISSLEQVISAGARRIAVSSEICHAEDPEAVARQLKVSLLLIQQAESASSVKIPVE